MGKSVNEIAKHSDKEEHKVIAVPIPPDGGYGWVIVAASFTLSMILDGICFTIGIFFNEFYEYFEGTKAETAWVGSVMNGVYMVMGPIVSGLCNRFGCRAVATVGCIFTCISFVIATFMPSLPLLTLTYGAMGGIGFGLFYLPAIVMVGFYFEKKRAMATGIAVCGSGIGGAVFAPFCSYLIDQYAWKGAILILAGVALNGMVLTTLFRPVKATVITRKESELAAPLNITERRRSRDAYFCSLSDMSSTRKRKISDGHEEQPSITKSCDQIWIAPTPSKQRSSLLTVDVSRPAFRKDTFMISGSLLKIPEYQETKEDAQQLSPYICSVTNLNPVHDAEKEQRQKLGKVRKVFKGVVDGVVALKDDFDISILKRITFLTYGACCLLCMLGFFVPFAYIPRLAVEHGFSQEEAASIIAIMSATNVVGRILAGVLSDRPWVDSIILNNVALILGGIAVSCIPHFPTMVPMVIASIFFGIAIATFVSLRSIIMVELMGLENLSNAFGFVTLFQGLSSLIGTPIAGALSDATGDFHSAFYMAGVTLSLAGIICIPLRRISVWENARLKRRSEHVENGVSHEVDKLMDKDSKL